MSCPPRPLRARPHPLRSPIPACRRLFPALRRPRSPCGLSLRPPASSAQPYPSVPRVLSVRRGKGGYWQRASACPIRRPPHRPARASASTAQSYPCLPPVLCAASPCARQLLPALRGKGGYWQRASACQRAASPCARIRIHCAVLSLPAAGFFLRSAGRADIGSEPARALSAARRVALRARPHPLRSPIPACRRFCVPRRPAPARPRSPCGLTPPARISSAALPLRAARRRVLSVRVSCAPPPAFPVRPIPARRGFCPPPVLPALRGKGGYWQGASACRARRVALRAAARVIRTALSLRAAGFVRPPREGRILAGIQRPPASPVRPIPAPARVIRTALSLRAAGFVRPPREGWILAGSQRVPCPPRHPARPPASSARPNPARRGFCPPRYPARRPPPGFVRPRLVRSAARVPRAAYPCAPRVLPAASPARASASTAQSYPCLPPVFSCAPPPASSARPNPARRGFCPPRYPARRRPRPPRGLSLRAAGSARLQFCLRSAGRADIGSEPARALSAARRVALRARPHPLRSPIPACRRLFPALRRPRLLCGLTLRAASPARASASTAQSYPCLPPAFSCAPPPAFPMRPIPAPARVPRAAYPCAPPASARAASGCIRAMP